jgi:hypothetical protein
MKLIYDESWVKKPKDNFALNKNAQLSTIGLRVNVFLMEDDRFYGMKSYDFHVFMQTLFSLVYHDLL